MFNLFKRGLTKTAQGISQAFTHKKLDAEALTDLEDALILADIGATTATQLVDDLRQQKFTKEDEVLAAKQWLREQLVAKLEPHQQRPELGQHQPELILFVGVNGAGKTTTLGKLAAQYQAQGKSVLLAAADTFRAGAVDQLKVWAERARCDIVLPAKEQADPAGVVYQAYEKAQAEKIDIVLADTAGRLQNRKDLMDQLAKINRVVKKLDDSAPHHVWQVLDATVGQNALSQVATFKELIGVTGLIVTKLDSSAKAGVLVPLLQEHELPLHYIGLGERTNDLAEFNAQDYVSALLDLPDSA